MKKINSLYIHIPFCESICDYCDFTKLQYFHNFAVSYINQLKNELDSLKINRRLKTIYIGGGTPTSLEDELFEKVLSFLVPYLDENYEFTVECNPESLSLNKIKLMKKYGVNRLSIGVESTDDRILKSINRKHTFLDVKNAVNLAKEIGINNINLDLILGLPNVSKSMLIKDVKNILSLDVNHISCYGLTVHEHTVFFNKNIEPPMDDELREMYDIVNELLHSKGYIHYEVSNWSKPNYYSRHNLTYWKDENYYAIGLGASGYIDNIKYTNTKNLTTYLKDYSIKDYQEEISKEDDETYYIMLNLRTIFGLNLREFSSIYNKDLYSLHRDYIDKCIKVGHLILENDILKPSEEGLMILDQIILELIK